MHLCIRASVYLCIRVFVHPCISVSVYPCICVSVHTIIFSFVICVWCAGETTEDDRAKADEHGVKAKAKQKN